MVKTDVMPGGKSMVGLQTLQTLLVVFTLLMSAPAVAEPVTLKLAFPSSDRSTVYLALAKPFVDEVNRRGRDVLKIEVSFSGEFARAPEQRPQFILDGKADIGSVVPGLTPVLFPDDGVIELPGLFRDAREASLVHTRLVAANVLRGYDDFVVIAAVATQPETIHSRKPIASLADIRGQKLRVNNATAAAFVSKLGATGVTMSINFAPEAIGSGRVDGALLQFAQLSDFGIGRLVTNHYILGTGSAPLALLMNRKAFDALSEPAKKIIRDCSGEWLATRYAEISDAANAKLLDEYKAEQRRRIAFPSPADQTERDRIANLVAEEWANASPRNRELLARVRAEIARLRESN